MCMDSARISGKFPCKACQELCLFCGQDRVKGRPGAKRQGQLWEVTELPGDLLSHRRPSVCVGRERGSERKGKVGRGRERRWNRFSRGEIRGQGINIPNTQAGAFYWSSLTEGKCRYLFHPWVTLT